jgi:H+/Cl- antiporter ClcA
VSDVSVSAAPADNGAPAAARNPAALIRTGQYRVLLILAAVVGLVVSAASWCFLEVVHLLQVWVYKDLPNEAGYHHAPLWWPLPWVALAGLLTAFAIVRLPGRGGHVPADGFKAGGARTQPIELPGVMLAAVATLSFGLVLGPEAPLIALGLGLGAVAMRLIKRDAPDQAVGLLAAAGSFAAIASIFGSPLIGGVLMIEVIGVGGAMLPLVLLPGLMAAGVGSLVFIGLGSFSGLSTTAWQLSPLKLPAFGGPGWGDFGWTILLAIATAVAVFVIMELGRRSNRVVECHPYLFRVAAGLAVGGLAIAFAESAGQSPDAVLFSGQDQMGSLVGDAATLSLSTLALLLLFKGLAWSICLGNFRGGPTFPAIFLGVAAGLMAEHLPGYSETQAVAALMGAAVVCVLRLPLSSVMVATLLCANAGLAVAPLIIVAVVVAYLTTEGLTAFAEARAAAVSSDTTTAPGPAAAAPVP